MNHAIERSNHISCFIFYFDEEKYRCLVWKGGAM